MKAFWRTQLLLEEGGLTSASFILELLRFECCCSPLAGLGAGSDANGAAGDTSATFRARVDHKTASNDALVTCEFKIFIVDIDLGDTLLVSNSRGQVTDEHFATISLGIGSCVCCVISTGIVTPVATERLASSAQVTEGVHVEAVGTWSDTPDLAVDLETFTWHLREVKNTTNPCFLLWVLEGTLGVLRLISDGSLGNVLVNDGLRLGLNVWLVWLSIDWAIVAWSIGRLDKSLLAPFGLGGVGSNSSEGGGDELLHFVLILSTDKKSDIKYL